MSRLKSSKLPLVIIICGTVLFLSAIVALTYIHEKQLSQQSKTLQIQQANARATDLFNKNQACAKYTNTIKQAIDENNKSPLALDAESLDSLFYSPVDNTCLYTTESLTTSGGDIGKREYFVYNALTQSKVTSFQFPSQYNEYKSFVLKYSGGEVRL
jgi:hypothetical protein